LTIQFLVLAVVTNDVSICLGAEIFYSMSIVYDSSKITVEYCSNGEDGRFKFIIGDSSDSRSDQLCATTDLVYTWLQMTRDLEVDSYLYIYVIFDSS